MAQRLVTPPMTSHDYDVILVTSQSSKSSKSETRSTIRVELLNTHYLRTLS